MADPWATVEELAGDRTSGAAELAERAAHALAGVPRGELPDAIEALLRGHPSMGPLWRLATEMLTGGDPPAGAERFLADLADDALAAAAIAPRLPESVLTISYSSTVLEALRLRRPGLVVCMNSLPGGEGRQMAEAASESTQAIVVSDEEAIERMPAAAVLTGADAVTPTMVLNKVKTREVAEAAARAGVPCYSVAGSTKLVAEELPVEPVMEPTALVLFSAIATPGGVLGPDEARTEALRARLHPALRLLIPRL